MDESLVELYGRLYLDQDVPIQLAGMLRVYGIDAITARDAGMLDRDDPEQLEFAVRSERALLTHNRRDFEALHAEYVLAGRPHFGILIAERRHLHDTRQRILERLNQCDRDQLRSGLFYV